WGVTGGEEGALSSVAPRAGGAAGGGGGGGEAGGRGVGGGGGVAGRGRRAGGAAAAPAGWRARRRVRLGGEGGGGRGGEARGRQGIGGGGDENGGEKLQPLPLARLVADGGGVGTGKQGEIGDRGQRAAVEPDAEGGRAVEARGGADGQGIERDAGGGG